VIETINSSKSNSRERQKVKVESRGSTMSGKRKANPG